jgi:hypothetical protein
MHERYSAWSDRSHEFIDERLVYRNHNGRAIYPQDKQ